MKKTIAALSALFIFAGASCNTQILNEPSVSHPDSPSTAAPITQSSGSGAKLYRKTPLKAPENMTRASCMVSVGSDVYISGIDEEMNTHIWKTDENFSRFTELVSHCENWCDYSILAPSADGLCSLTVHYYYGDGSSFPTKEEYDRDPALYSDSERIMYTIERYSQDGEIVSTTMLDLAHDESNGIIGFCANPDETYTVVLDDSFCNFSAGGNLIKSDSIGDSGVCKFCVTKSGSILCTINDDSDAANYKILTVDPVTLRIVSEADSNGHYVEQIETGHGGHYAIVGAASCLYGFSGGRLTKIVDLDSIDISADMFTCIGEESFIILDNSGDVTNFYRCEPRSDEEMSRLRVVRVAGRVGEEIGRLTAEFNEEHEGEIFFDTSYDFSGSITDGSVREGKGSLADNVINSILSGNPPDLVVTDDYVSMQKIAAYGGFADLYKFIDSDPVFSRGDFLTNVLSLNEYGGRLCMMPHGFSVRTLVAKTKWTAGAGENWTSAEMNAAVAQMPAGMAFSSDYTTPNECLQKYFFFNSSSFIDYENRTCRFDSPEFIAMLERLKNGPFGSSEDVERLGKEGRWDEYTELKKWAVMRDESLVIEGFSDYNSYKNMTAMFGDEPFTIVGAPSENGRGGAIHFGYTFGIVEGSEEAEAAWEFVKYFLSDDVQLSVSQNGFGGNIDGNSVLVKYRSGDSRYDEYVRNIGKTATYDYGAFEIIREECEEFLTGERTAEETARAIQERAKVLVEN